MMVTFSLLVSLEVGHSLKFLLSQSMPELFSSFATLSKAGQEALEGNFHKKKVPRKINQCDHCKYEKSTKVLQEILMKVFLIAVLQDELTAAAEKSLVTILPKASQGDVN